MDEVNPPCPDCRSLHTTKKGFGVLRPGRRKQRYQCMNCGRTFYPEEEDEK